jgi:XTP/dITP diphosphohydrolase
MTDTALPSMDALAASMRTVLDNCVWSQTMTHASLVTYLIEESYELIDAVEANDRDVMLEELGDVLLQVVFHAEIARRTPAERFTLDDIARAANEKMIRRHPHVFGDETALTVDEVWRVWSAAKAAEKVSRTSALDGIPQSMPALALAEKVLTRAERAGLGAPGSRERPEQQFSNEEELGRILLDISAAARFQGLDAERALRSALRELQEGIRERETASDPA